MIAGDGLLQSQGDSSRMPEGSRDIGSVSSKRDLKEIPVGLPFTEMVERAKNFNVTQLHTERQSVRQTEMQPVQVCAVLAARGRAS